MKIAVVIPASKPRYALFGAGGAARSFLADLPCLRRELGPIAASNTKVAGRIANVLRTGHSVRELAAFNECAVVLVCAPDTGINRPIALLQASPVQWAGKILLFCASRASAAEYSFFEDRGASAGSLSPLEGVAGLFVVEGGREAVREAKRLVKELKGRPLEIKSGRMPIFDAARTFSSSLFTPLIDSCVESLHHAGVHSKEATSVAEALLIRSLRSYLHSGRRGWAGPVPKRDWPAIELQYDALKTVDPLRAEFFRDSARHAFTLYESCPEFERYLVKKPSS